MVEPLTAGSEIVLEAVFRSWDSHLLSDIAAFGVGAVGAGGPEGEVVAGAVAHLGSRPSQLPHWILVHTDANGVSLFASDTRGTKGRQLLEAGRGTFRASLHRSIGQVQLMLFVPDSPSVALRAKSGPRRRTTLQVARTVLALAAQES